MGWESPVGYSRMKLRYWSVSGKGWQCCLSQVDLHDQLGLVGEAEATCLGGKTLLVGRKDIYNWNSKVKLTFTIVQRNT